MSEILQKCPNCKHKVFALFSNWNSKINNGSFNCCAYCAPESIVEKNKSLKELNKERQKRT